MIRPQFSGVASAIAAVALAFGMSAVQAKSATGGSAFSSAGHSSYAPLVSYAPVTDVYDLTGVPSMDDYGSSFNFVGFGFLGANAHVIGIGWNLNIETVGASWLSEAVIGFTNAAQTAGVNLTAGIGDDFSGVGSYSSGGVVDLVGLGLDFNVGADGNLRVEFFESFDDHFQSVGANSLPDSALYVQFETPVPEASTYAMMALGLAGIGLAVRRRRA